MASALDLQASEDRSGIGIMVEMGGCGIVARTGFIQKS